MSEYVWSTDGIERDELQGGIGEFQEIWNITVGESAIIERGMLLGASSPTAEFSLVESLSDLNDVFVIARDNFTADEEHTVTQAYAGGTFNAEKIILGGDSTLTIEPFINELRRQNIRVRHIQDKF